ncbi:MAG: hypothetical protein JRH20_29080 [Deltaproteobacteria bacterium]|nr:hypothetical protein [Deltaproteobacteria bacterium]
MAAGGEVKWKLQRRITRSADSVDEQFDTLSPNADNVLRVSGVRLDLLAKLVDPPRGALA